jgi:hypothetical protein
MYNIETQKLEGSAGISLARNPWSMDFHGIITSKKEFRF